ncbi:MAG: cytochrome c3 family protein [Myxococcota bacterium]
MSAVPLLIWMHAAVLHAQIVGTAHDLSATGPGPIRALQEPEVCIFCHAPHTASPVTPLWNRSLPTLAYTLYSSSTLQAATGQPTGTSKLCLSCHDGTIALGSVLSRAEPIAMSEPLSGRSDLTTDLSDDHPISFAYDAVLAGQDPELLDPGLLPPAVSLDSAGELQCTSCHDPHSAQHPDFLVLDNAFSALCTACHEKTGWLASAHQSSMATWNGAGSDPWPHTDAPTVGENGCEGCHAPHAAGSGAWLLNFFFEEENCLRCHNGNVASLDIAGELQKPYRHPVDSFVGAHEPDENPLSMPWHVECADCHEPHQARAGPALAPDVSGPLTGAGGVTAGGTPIAAASFQYEVCFRCHADNPAAPLPQIQRVIHEPNLRLRFSLGGPSFHPVEGPGRNPDVPSLIGPLSESSVIYCTDCHAGDDGPGVGGGGPAGPHGSSWPFLLEREYRTVDNTPESAQAYALCYKCHDRSSILGDESFAKHKKHIEGERAPCSVCHDPHGIPAGSGSPTGNSHLINFDTGVVQPNPQNGRLEFVDEGFRQGACTLLCHGKRHQDQRYK